MHSCHNNNLSSQEPVVPEKLNHGVTLKRLLHTFFSVGSALSLIYGSFCTLLACYTEKYSNLAFMKHGYEYSPFFLSLWVAGIHMVYYYLYSVIDVVEVYFNSNKNLLGITEHIHKVASYLLFTIIFPMSLYVSIAFWTAYMWDRETMYPSALDDVLPSWLNHAMHTIPLPTSILYMVVSNRHEPPKTATIAGMVVFLSVYWGMFVSMKFVYGKWVYLFFNNFSNWESHIIILLSLTVPILFLHIGYKINSSIKVFKSNLRILSIC